MMDHDDDDVYYYYLMVLLMMRRRVLMVSSIGWWRIVVPPRRWSRALCHVQGMGCTYCIIVPCDRLKGKFWFLSRNIPLDDCNNVMRRSLFGLIGCKLQNERCNAKMN